MQNRSGDMHTGGARLKEVAATAGGTVHVVPWYSKVDCCIAK